MSRRSLLAAQRLSVTGPSTAGSVNKASGLKAAANWGTRRCTVALLRSLPALLAFLWVSDLLGHEVRGATTW